MLKIEVKQNLCKTVTFLIIVGIGIFQFLPISVHSKIDNKVDFQTFGLLILIFLISLYIKAYTYKPSHKICSRKIYFFIF